MKRHLNPVITDILKSILVFALGMVVGACTLTYVVCNDEFAVIEKLNTYKEVLDVINASR